MRILASQRKAAERKTDAECRLTGDGGQQRPNQRAAPAAQLVEIGDQVEPLLLAETEADFEAMRVLAQRQHAIDQTEGVARQHHSPAQ
jgi:hypothetical protein